MVDGLRGCNVTQGTRHTHHRPSPTITLFPPSPTHPCPHWVPAGAQSTMPFGVYWGKGLPSSLIPCTSTRQDTTRPASQQASITQTRPAAYSWLLVGSSAPIHGVDGVGCPIHGQSTPVTCTSTRQDTTRPARPARPASQQARNRQHHPDPASSLFLAVGRVFGAYSWRRRRLLSYSWTAGVDDIIWTPEQHPRDIDIDTPHSSNGVDEPGLVV